MRELTSPFWIIVKAWLFLLLGLMAAGLLLHEKPTLWTASLLAIAIWSFCRLYYFLFYVIEHYIDSSYRFSGLYSFLRFSLGREKSR